MILTLGLSSVSFEIMRCICKFESWLSLQWGTVIILPFSSFVIVLTNVCGYTNAAN